MSKLYRSTTDRMITGIAGGLSNVFGIDSTWIRILLVISIFLTSGLTILIYLIAAMVIPKEPYGPYNGLGGMNYQQGPNYNQGGYNGGGYGQSNSFHKPPQSNQPPYSQGGNPDLDSMMEDIEKKAMKKEIEELRKKLSSYEKGDR